MSHPPPESRERPQDDSRSQPDLARTSTVRRSDTPSRGVVETDGQHHQTFPERQEDIRVPPDSAIGENPDEPPYLREGETPSDFVRPQRRSQTVPRQPLPVRILARKYQSIKEGMRSALEQGPITHDTWMQNRFVTGARALSPVGARSTSRELRSANARTATALPESPKETESQISAATAGSIDPFCTTDSAAIEEYGEEEIPANQDEGKRVPARSASTQLPVSVSKVPQSPHSTREEAWRKAAGVPFGPKAVPLSEGLASALSADYGGGAAGEPLRERTLSTPEVYAGKGTALEESDSTACRRVPVLYPGPRGSLLMHPPVAPASVKDLDVPEQTGTPASEAERNLFNYAQFVSKSSQVLDTSKRYNQYISQYLKMNPHHPVDVDSHSFQDLFEAAQVSRPEHAKPETLHVIREAPEPEFEHPRQRDAETESEPSRVLSQSRVIWYDDRTGRDFSSPSVSKPAPIGETAELPPRIEAFELPCYFSDRPQRILMVLRTWSDDVAALGTAIAHWLQTEWDVCIFAEGDAVESMARFGATNLCLWCRESEASASDESKNLLPFMDEKEKPSSGDAKHEGDLAHGGHEFGHLAVSSAGCDLGEGDLLPQIDFVVSIGGDGTTLWVSTMFPDVVPPVVSISLGSLAYLNQFRPDEAMGTLQQILTCQVFNVQLRARLVIQVLDADNTPILVSHVVNEAVVDRGPTSSLIEADVYINEQFFTTVTADGLILATPSGSTAYSMSAGGAMVHPNVPCILFTPICPHTLSMRPLVLPDSAVVRLRNPIDSRSSIWLSLDGRVRQEVRRGQSVVIAISPFPFPLVCKSSRECGDSWMSALKSNLNWNMRIRQKAHAPPGPSAQPSAEVARTIPQTLERTLPADIRRWLRSHNGRRGSESSVDLAPKQELAPRQSRDIETSVSGSRPTLPTGDVLNPPSGDQASSTHLRFARGAPSGIQQQSAWDGMLGTWSGHSSSAEGSVKDDDGCHEDNTQSRTESAKRLGRKLPRTSSPGDFHFGEDGSRQFLRQFQSPQRRHPRDDGCDFHDNRSLPNLLPSYPNDDGGTNEGDRNCPLSSEASVISEVPPRTISPASGLDLPPNRWHRFSNTHSTASKGSSCSAAADPSPRAAAAPLTTAPAAGECSGNTRAAGGSGFRQMRPSESESTFSRLLTESSNLRMGSIHNSPAGAAPSSAVTSGPPPQAACTRSDPSIPPIHHSTYGTPPCGGDTGNAVPCQGNGVTGTCDRQASLRSLPGAFAGSSGSNGCANSLRRSPFVQAQGKLQAAIAITPAPGHSNTGSGGKRARQIEPGAVVGTNHLSPRASDPPLHPHAAAVPLSPASDQMTPAAVTSPEGSSSVEFPSQGDSCCSRLDPQQPK